MSAFAVLIFSLSETFFNVDFYKDHLLEEFYEIGGNIAAKRVMSPDLPFSKYFTSEEIVEYIHEAVPFEIIRSEISGAFDQISAFDITGTEKKQISFSLIEIKSRVPKIAPVLLEKLFEKVPQCEPGFAPKEDSVPDCIPSGVTKAQVFSQLDSFLNSEVFKKIPDTYRFELPSPPEDMKQGLSVAIPIIKNANLIMTVVLLFFVLIVALILWRPVHRTLMWEGWMFILGGLNNGVLAYLLKIGPNKISPEFFRGTNIPEEYFSDVLDILSGVLSLFADSMLKFSAIFAGVGVLCVLTAVLLKRRA